MLSEGITVKSTHAVALAGLVTPVWLPSLATISEHAAVWTPILGAVWLVTQIVRAWFFGKGRN